MGGIDFELALKVTMQDLRRIIVIDDDHSLLTRLGRLLRQHLFEPLLFSSAQDFMSRTDFEQACCIVLDTNLQDGTGIALRDRITRAGVTTPVIFMTGKTDDRTPHRALAVSC